MVLIPEALCANNRELFSVWRRKFEAAGETPGVSACTDVQACSVSVDTYTTDGEENLSTHGHVRGHFLAINV